MKTVNFLVHGLISEGPQFPGGMLLLRYGFSVLCVASLRSYSIRPSDGMYGWWCLIGPTYCIDGTI